MLLEPRDIIWRLTERLDEQRRVLDESHRELHPKHNSDLIRSLEEIERLTATQQNILNRIRKRYDS